MAQTCLNTLTGSKEFVAKWLTITRENHQPTNKKSNGFWILSPKRLTTLSTLPVPISYSMAICPLPKLLNYIPTDASRDIPTFSWTTWTQNQRKPSATITQVLRTPKERAKAKDADAHHNVTRAKDEGGPTTAALPPTRKAKAVLTQKVTPTKNKASPNATTLAHALLPRKKSVPIATTMVTMLVTATRDKTMRINQKENKLSHKPISTLK